jgi:ATP-binding cassette subfamily B protein/subfamily B ATP-binding cassette protein MsbA
MKSWSMRLLAAALPQRSRVAAILGLSVAGVLVDTLKPWPAKLAIDYVLAKQPLPGMLKGLGNSGEALAWLAVSTVILFLTGWALRAAETFFKSDTGGRLTYALAAKLFAHVQALPLGFHRRQATGDTVKRITTDTRCAKELVLDVLLPAITIGTSLLAMFAILWRLNTTLALVAAPAAPLLYLIFRRFRAVLEMRGYDEAEAQSAIFTAAEQTLTAMPAVQAFGRETVEYERFQELNRDSGLAYLRNIRSQLGLKVASGAVIALTQGVVLGAGGALVVLGRATAGDLIVFLSYLAALYGPLSSLAYLGLSWSSAAAGARRVFATLDEPAWPPAVTHQPTEGTRGDVRCENVTFDYDDGRPVLRDVNFHVMPGETVLLVGETGAGKTTLLMLLDRFYDPQSGRISLDGRDLSDLPLEWLRSQICIVLQDSLLLPASVRDNIALANPAASPEDIEAAARAAAAHDFIMQLPDGYATRVGDGAARLSGGERQRIALARAFLLNAPVLVLDEPTASLDAATEQTIWDSITRLRKGRTTIVVTHRDSGSRIADRTVRIDRGAATESGAVHA